MGNIGLSRLSKTTKNASFKNYFIRSRLKSTYNKSNKITHQMKTFIVLFLILLSFNLRAQYGEAGVITGVTNYLGDLVPPRTFFLGTSFSVGGVYQYNFTNRISIRGNVLYGQLRGDDNNSNYDSGRRQRNLDFKTDLFEISVVGQVNILPFQPTSTFRPITPYGFLGFAVFHFNPYTNYLGEKTFLQPLGTEGQGIDGYPEKYKLWEIAIPMGLGVKFCLHPRVNLSVELGMRKTFTDYIDDVSGDYVNLQTLRQNSGLLTAELSNRTYDNNGNQIELENSPRGHAGKDWYTFMGITVTYSMHKQNQYFKPKKKKASPKKTPREKKKESGRWM